MTYPAKLFQFPIGSSSLLTGNGQSSYALQVRLFLQHMKCLLINLKGDSVLLQFRQLGTERESAVLFRVSGQKHANLQLQRRIRIAHGQTGPDRRTYVHWTMYENPNRGK